MIEHLEIKLDKFEENTFRRLSNLEDTIKEISMTMTSAIVQPMGSL
jgi:hypothetical protein